MPGPGGGARGGGGGSRGGGFGGSRGGGFGGGHRPGGFHYGTGMHMGGWHRRTRYVGGGGCLSATVSSVFAILIVIVVLFGFISSTVTEIAQGGSVTYDENKFQDYADAQYADIFGDTRAYEDNLLIVVLVDENYSDYYYIAWVGDHIVTDINWMMGGNDTELGWAMADSINSRSYKYSLDSNLAAVMDIMTRHVQELGLESSVTCNDSHPVMTADLINHTELPLTEATVEDALERFATATGIPAAIVVEDMEDVFGKGFSGISLVTLVLVAVVVIIVIVSISKSRRRASEVEGPESTRRYDDDEGY